MALTTVRIDRLIIVVLVLAFAALFSSGCASNESEIRQTGDGNHSESDSSQNVARIDSLEAKLLEMTQRVDRVEGDNATNMAKAEANDAQLAGLAQKAERVEGDVAGIKTSIEKIENRASFGLLNVGDVTGGSGLAGYLIATLLMIACWKLWRLAQRRRRNELHAIHAIEDGEKWMDGILNSPKPDDEKLEALRNRDGIKADMAIRLAAETPFGKLVSKTTKAA